MRKGTLSWLLLAVALIHSSGADQASLSAVTRGNNDFSAQLYDAIRKSTNDNLIVSPISVSTAVAMLQAGARGSTADAIRSTMRFPSSDDQLHNGYQILLQQLKSDDSITLEMANKLYPAEGYKLNPTFTDILRTYYGAEPQQLNYAQSDLAASVINHFVSNATHDRIRDLINSRDLDQMTRLVLINAIYFKGTWKNQFPREDTTKMDFYTSATDTVPVDMMRLETEMMYGEIHDLDAKVVSLPYKGDRLSMVIILPNQRDGLTTMENQLKDYPLEQIISNLRERKVQLYLPKFKLESTIDLKEPLQKLGLESIFNDRADLSGIPADDGKSKERLYVSKAIQKAFIEVNEEGSEAAAATGKTVQKRSIEEIPSVRVDHSFIYGIVVGTKKNAKSKKTISTFTSYPTILFCGAVLQLSGETQTINRDEL